MFRLARAYSASGQPPAYFAEHLSELRRAWLLGAFVTSLFCFACSGLVVVARSLPRYSFLIVATLVVLLAPPLALDLISRVSDPSPATEPLQFRCLLLPPALLWSSLLLVSCSTVGTLVATASPDHA